MVIEPGDLIIGDDDGLLCVPFDDVDEVLKAATAKYEASRSRWRTSRRGRNAAWVDKTLRELNCEELN